MINISWEQYQDILHEFHEKILKRMEHLDKDQSIHLIGIPRGGLMIALHLTYLDDRYELINEDPSQLSGINDESIVLVDDVLETGKTIEHWRAALSHLNSFVFAALIDKSKCYNIASADVSVVSMDKKRWVTFPWESRLAEKIEADKCYKGEANGN